jgi:hypothetical protein
MKEERAGTRTRVGRVDAMSKSLRARACSSNRTQSSVASAACTASLLRGDDVATLEHDSASGSVDLLHLVCVVCVCVNTRCLRVNISCRQCKFMQGNKYKKNARKIRMINAAHEINHCVKSRVSLISAACVPFAPEEQHIASFTATSLSTKTGRPTRSDTWYVRPIWSDTWYARHMAGQSL